MQDKNPKVTEESQKRKLLLFLITVQKAPNTEKEANLTVR